MWVWREDRAVGTPVGGPDDARGDARRRGWALDAHGGWTWAEPSPLERRGAGVDALRGRPAMTSIPSARSELRSEPWYGPAATPVPTSTRPPLRAVQARTGRTSDDPTPIFHALTVDRTRRATLHAVPVAGDPRLGIPEPSPGSGPLPVQDPHAGRRGLAEVPTVPPPPGPGDRARGAVEAAPAESPQEELRRRAERRRRPQGSTTAGREGRHALRAVEPEAGRHAMR